jgi:hypothetical protein
MAMLQTELKIGAKGQQTGMMPEENERAYREKFISDEYAYHISDQFLVC